MEGKQLKILLLGSSDSGKSALIDRYIGIKHEQGPTVVRSVTFPHLIELNKFQTPGKEKIQFESQRVVLTLVEVGGMHPVLIDEAIRDADGYMLVYSVGSKESFTFAYELFQRIMKAKFSGAFGTLPIMLVGSKIDLASENALKTRAPNSFQRQVTFDMGQELAYLMNIKFMETTCMAPTSVALLFRTIIHQCQLYSYHESEKHDPVASKKLKIKDLFKKKPGLKKYKSMGDMRKPTFVSDAVRVWLPEEIMKPSFPGSLRSQIDMAFAIQTAPRMQSPTGSRLGSPTKSSSPVQTFSPRMHSPVQFDHPANPPIQSFAPRTQSPVEFTPTVQSPGRISSPTHTSSSAISSRSKLDISTLPRHANGSYSNSLPKLDTISHIQPSTFTTLPRQGSTRTFHSSHSSPTTPTRPFDPRISKMQGNLTVMSIDRAVATKRKMLKRYSDPIGIDEKTMTNLKTLIDDLENIEVEREE